LSASSREWLREITIAIGILVQIAFIENILIKRLTILDCLFYIRQYRDFPEDARTKDLLERMGTRADATGSLLAPAHIPWLNAE